MRLGAAVDHQLDAVVLGELEQGADVGGALHIDHQRLLAAQHRPQGFDVQRTEQRVALHTAVAAVAHFFKSFAQG